MFWFWYLILAGHFSSSVFSIDKTGSAFGSCSLLVGAGAGTSLNEQLPEEEKHKPETRGQCVMVKENWS